MNNNLKNIFANFGLFISILFPYKIYVNLKKIKKYIFSGYMQRQFRSVGDNFNIDYPIILLGGDCITIGNNFVCYSRLRIEAYVKHLDNFYNPKISIGNNVSLNFDCHIACVNYISIGNNVLIASKVFITDHSHGDPTKDSLKTPPYLRKVVSKGPVIIEDNVWIGEGVCILPGVTIGKNSIIGANAVVTKSFPKNSIIAGVPATLIKSI